MDAAMSEEVYIPEDIPQPLLKAANFSTLNEALQVLIGVSRTEDGRSHLASKHILPVVLQLVQSLSYPLAHHILLLSLRLLRNLCAGEVVNQNLFIGQKGIEVDLSVINAVGYDPNDSACVITRTALQVMANVALEGEKNQHAIWEKLFPDFFMKIARIRRRETCDPLCMIIYTCCDGSIHLESQLCTNSGLAIMAEVVRTASEVKFGEDWIKILLSRICLEESHLPALFLCLSDDFDNLQNDGSSAVRFTKQQAFLLQMVSEILNERLEEIYVNSEFAIYVLGLFHNAVRAVDFYTRGTSKLPTGVPSIDVLGYSLAILRDVCAQKSSAVTEAKGIVEDAVESLLSRGLLDLLLSFLHEVELPSSIRKTMKLDEDQASSSHSPKVCPYKGFRRDIVAVIGNCLYGRKNVQDEVREENSIILLLQQCVLDEDNAFLREWGIWCANNLLQSNAENQQMVAEMEMQGTVEVPELAKLGLRVEIDPITNRAKLVNI